MVVRSCWHGPNQEGRRVILHAKQSRILYSFQPGDYLSCNLEPVLADNLLRMELAITAPAHIFACVSECGGFRMR